MKRFVILAAGILLPFLCLAQFSITGKVVNQENNEPIAKASIFLSNTTLGTTTAEDGTFTLSNVKSGQYDFIVSVVGFETVQLNVIANANINLQTIKLKPKITQLQEVVVKPDREWEQNYAMFKRQLFGPNEFAEQCKILNPEVLDLNNNKREHLLNGKSNGYLEIENNALGYKLHYDLRDFEFDYRANSFYYQWSVLFEEMKGSSSQQRRWARNRKKAFYGSAEHYFKSLLGYQMEKEGFKTLTLVKKDNPQRPSDSLIRAMIARYRQPAYKLPANVKADSLNIWLSKTSIPKTVQYLINKPVHVDSLVQKTDVKGLFAIAFKDYMYVIYKQSAKSADAFDYARMPGTSVVSISDPYIFFDSNGVVANLHGVTYEGDWATRRVATLLPVDYEPEHK